MEIAVMGIDPGITGGFAAICSTHILVDDLPVLTEANGRRKEKALDANELYKKFCAKRIEEIEKKDCDLKFETLQSPRKQTIN